MLLDRTWRWRRTDSSYWPWRLRTYLSKTETCPCGVRVGLNLGGLLGKVARFVKVPQIFLLLCLSAQPLDKETGSPNC